MYDILHGMNVEIDGFVETRPGREELFGLAVFCVDDIDRQNSILILGMTKLNTDDVKKIISEKGFNLENVIEGYSYIEGGGDRGGYDRVPTIEITTRVGCGVNCRYCPQSTLIKRYTGAGDADIVMSPETFKVCLDKLPANCNILFCGMAEPFLNPSCTDMIKYAIASGRKVDLYTTLVGVNEAMLDEILELPVSFVTLHVADKFGYANIKTDDSYYRMVEKIINHHKADGSPFVNICNAQAEPDERVKQICDGKYAVMHELQDRAGNLSDDRLISAGKITKKGRLTCSICGQELNHNILLPDGTVLLCCMDYGMKHVLGNLLEQSYDEIRHGAEIQKIMKAIEGDEDIDVLCRRCTSANQI